MNKRNEIELKLFGNEERILSIFNKNLKLKARVEKRLDENKFVIKIEFKDQKTPAEIKKWLLAGPWEKYLYEEDTDL